MKVSYKGVHHDLPAKLQKKLEAKFAKISKLLEQKGEKEAHVILTHERHLHNAEITLQFYDHKLVAIGSDGDLAAAMTQALAKLEKQAQKLRSKVREKYRRNGPDKTVEDSSGSGRVSAKTAMAKQTAVRQTSATRTSKAAVKVNGRGPRIFHVEHRDRRKPITVEEAMLHMEDGRDYMVYRDSEKECVSVLVRRKDGHFDLVEV